MSFKILTSILPFLYWHLSFGQSNNPPSTSSILLQLERLNTLGSAMYIAAHPDDENTQLIAYLVNGAHIRTGYLAATRGDGGQNLVGPEIREKLGVIRTQELLSARRLDGGEQFFSRANDFGYSKNPDETFNMWDREKVLADFVWAIRKFRPDVLITRFNPEPGITHGHHTASAILAKEAFKLAGDPSAFAGQLQWVEVWQPKKLFWNTSPWFYRMSGREFDEEQYIKVDVGQYSPYLGKSFTELAAESRSMHKSQGFGATGSRGSNFEYLEQWEGPNTGDLFGGVDVTWGRISGSEEVAYHTSQALLNFDPAAPYRILPDLLSARKELLGIRDQFWKEVKLEAIRHLIRDITGTFMEATANDFLFVPGDSIQINLEIINRSPAAISLSGVKYSLWEDRSIHNLELIYNQKSEFTTKWKLPEGLIYTNPYWLEEAGSEGMYTVSKQQLRGLPENPQLITAEVTLKMDGQFLEYEIPVVFKRNDPIRGETIRPLELAPKVMVNLDDQALVFADDQTKRIPVRLVAGQDDIKGSVYLDLPEGWRSEPPSISFHLEDKNEEQLVTFELIPPSQPSSVTFTAVATVNGEKFMRGKVSVTYEHIMPQLLFPVSKARAVRLDLKRAGNRIGYLMGAGDEVPFSLEQIGYEVMLLEKDQVTREFLRQFDAVVLGIRAYNTLSWLAFKNEELFAYVKDGGNLIVQYNTSHQLVTADIAPYPLKLSRDRVAVEDAPVTILAKRHSVLNKPNKITEKDFEGWVQERGLYFPDEWAEEFEPIISTQDPEEEARTGSLLIAKYGKGYYCYTGLSFFRELPAGVPGAYRLLTNLISLGKESQLK